MHTDPSGKVCLPCFLIVAGLVLAGCSAGGNNNTSTPQSSPVVIPSITPNMSTAPAEQNISPSPTVDTCVVQPDQCISPSPLPTTAIPMPTITPTNIPSPTPTPDSWRLPVDNGRLSNCDFVSRTGNGIASRDVNPIGVSSQSAPVYAPTNSEVMIVDTDGNNAGLGNFVAIRVNTGDGFIYIGFAHLASVNVSVGDTPNSSTVIGMTGQSGTDNIHLDITTFFVPSSNASNIAPVPGTVNSNGASDYQAFYTLGLTQLYEGQTVDPLEIWPGLSEGTICEG